MTSPRAKRPPAEPAAPPAPTRGRPRDPLLEDRVFEAAIRLYADTGWVGFNFDAVAKRAGVGKAALYRRWTTRGELLRDTFEARWYLIDRIDTGSLRGDLVALGRMSADIVIGPYGRAAQHIVVDVPRYPEVFTSTARYRESTVRQARAIVRRAQARGELADIVKPGLLIDLVVGGIANRVQTTPDRLRPTMIATMDDFL
ncbi:MAG: transcriptional regulator, partial [Jatrophihabitantaceae bacterium]|nr:transcriptional regulator [Jatrophihabitantaceae bacterium]